MDDLIALAAVEGGFEWLFALEAYVVASGPSLDALTLPPPLPLPFSVDASNALELHAL